MKFLIVDDDPQMLRLLRRVLEGMGYSDIVEAYDGEVAEVQHFNSSRPSNIDFLITDNQMPYMTGLELINALRAQDEQIPILLLTCDEGEEIERQAETAGANGYLHKPYSPQELRQKINEILASRVSSPQ